MFLEPTPDVTGDEYELPAELPMRDHVETTVPPVSGRCSLARAAVDPRSRTPQGLFQLDHAQARLGRARPDAHTPSLPLHVVHEFRARRRLLAVGLELVTQPAGGQQGIRRQRAEMIQQRHDSVHNGRNTEMSCDDFTGPK